MITGVEKYVGDDEMGDVVLSGHGESWVFDTAD
jgi:hypothetical protein